MRFLVVCRFGMTSAIHSDQGREFENKIMQELCLLCRSHKTRTTPYHPESDGMVERFNRTLLMMLAMFAGKKPMNHAGSLAGQSGYKRNRNPRSWWYIARISKRYQLHWEPYLG